MKRLKFLKLPKIKHYSKQVFSVNGSVSNGLAMLKFKPLIQEERVPVNISCVIDTSGSMEDECIIKSSNGNSDGYGFSTLDLVKHSLNTIVHSLNENDKLSLIEFNSDANLVQVPLEMTNKNKDFSLKSIDSLKADGNTNLWAGLMTGMKNLNEEESKNQVVLLLTDGMPNVLPPRGHVPSMLLHKNNNRVPVVNSFGFGSKLDSQLLNDLSSLGNGSFSFIPDGSFVGTVFVNTLANVLTTIATNIKITIENSSIQDFTIEDKDTIIDFGSLNLEQERSLVFPFYSKSLTLKIEYYSPFHKGKQTERMNINLEEGNPDEIYPQYFRMRASKLLVSTKDTNQLSALINDIKDYKSKTPYVNDLLKDLEGEGKLAFSSQYYQKWGKHYLLSLGGAHSLQQCNNFKDPGVQHYGGKSFNTIRDQLDQIFLTIPIPKPSIKTYSSVQVQNMNVFYDPSGPCFDGSGIVKMKKGYKLVSEIKKGDILDGNKKVLCVVKTNKRNKKASLVNLKGAKVTPWHPFKTGSKYDFPFNHGKTEVLDCPAVYNFVLEDKGSIIINDIEFVTLGHGLQEESVKHDYYGTEKVIDDLKTMNGWENGLIELNDGCVIRDEFGKVCKLVQESFKEMSSSNLQKSI